MCYKNDKNENDRQNFDTMFAASSDNEWLKRPIKNKVLETVLCQLRTSLKGLVLRLIFTTNR